MSAPQPGRRGRRVEAAAAAGSWLRPQLRRALRDVLGDVRGRLRRRGSDGRPVAGPALHPMRVASLRLGARPPRSDRLAAAERELARVHLAELAFLLREASRLRRDPEGARRAQACREGLAEALDCARRDDLQLAGSWRRLARACVDAPWAAWPGATELARAALDLEPCETGRAELARALLSDGDAPGAARALAAALLTCPSAGRGAGLLEELAAVEERLGRGRRARSLRGWASRVRGAA